MGELVNNTSSLPIGAHRGGGVEVIERGKGKGERGLRKLVVLGGGRIQGEGGGEEEGLVVSSLCLCCCSVTSGLSGR